jgi:hypothetical protein
MMAETLARLSVVFLGWLVSITFIVRRFLRSRKGVLVLIQTGFGSKPADMLRQSIEPKNKIKEPNDQNQLNLV